MIDWIGHQLGNYRITQLLGQGGFATVYLGEHLYLKSQVAIKVLHPTVPHSEQADFLREAQCLVGLRHPHIVQCLDFAMKDDIPFLVMEYAPHGSLRTQHPRGSRLPFETIIGYTQQVADALQYLHEHKLVHRDVKPENLLLGVNQNLLLSDFGIVATAHRTSSLIEQNLVGTPGYMAPELLEGLPRPASDQYALGVLVYEWLCGRRPFLGSNWSVVEQHFHTSPPPLHEYLPTISSDLESVVLKALAKDPKQRFASVQDFVDSLEEAEAITQKFPVAARSHSGQSALPFTAFEEAHHLNSPAPVIPVRAASLLATSTPQPIVEAASSLPIREAVRARKRVSRRGIVLGLGLGLTGFSLTAWAMTHLMPSHAAPLAKTSPQPTSTVSPPSVGTVLSSYTGHSDGVSALAWSPDGQYLASASLDGTVQVSDAATGKNVHTYDGHTEPLYAVAWSPNGTWIASGGAGRTVFVWNVQDGRVIFTYRGHTSYVTTLSWSANSKCIVSGAAHDQAVQVWEALSGETYLTYNGHPDGVNSVAYSPNGRYIASGGNDKTVQVWNATTGNQVYTYQGHTNAVAALAWSPDSKRIVSTDKASIQAWDATDGQHLLVYREMLHSISGLAWSPDGQRIAASSLVGRAVQLWDATNAELLLIHHWKSAAVCAVAWSPKLDDSRIAQTGMGPVQVWIGR